MLDRQLRNVPVAPRIKGQCSHGGRAPPTSGGVLRRGRSDPRGCKTCARRGPGGGIPMFDNLSEKLQRMFKNLRGQGKLTEENIGRCSQGNPARPAGSRRPFQGRQAAHRQHPRKVTGRGSFDRAFAHRAGCQDRQRRVDGDPRLDRVEGALLLHAADGLHDRRPAGFRQDDVRRQAGALVVAARA